MAFRAIIITFKFSYSNIKLKKDTFSGNASLDIEVEVKNTGKVAGKEVVECYIHDEIASISPDVMKLVRFNKIELKSGESKKVNFSLTKEDLAFVGMENKWITEPGKFILFVGGNPKELKQKSFWWVIK